MNNERRTFWPLLAAMMLLLTATLILTLKLERQPSMQRPVSDITYQQHWELDDVLQEVLNLMRAGRFTSAQSLLNAVLKEFPDNPDVWMLRGSVFYRQEKFSEAAHAFRKVIEYQPENAAACNNMAESLIRLKHYDEARNAIYQAVTLAPENGEILLNAAGLYALINDDKTAVLYLKKALTRGITPEMVSRHRELIRLLERPDFVEYYNSQQPQVPRKNL